MRRPTEILGTVCAVSALLLGACGTAEHAVADAPDYAGVQPILDRVTTADGAPGVLLGVRDAHGRTTLTSGVANLATAAPMDGASRFRIGSMTKTFVAAVVLQLVGEGRVALDAPVETYLPGIVRGNGNNGQDITVRQLLQHTSGLPDYLDHIPLEQVLKDPLRHYDPLELVHIGLAHPPLFPPGSDWSYSNTNYVLAGMIIERVTGRAPREAVEQRIIQPLGLDDTTVPGDGPGIPGTHPRGYGRHGSADPLDLTELNPSIASSAGGMISSAADLNKFLDALVNGQLLPPPERAAMTTTRPLGNSHHDAYGLGLQSTPLPCGGLYWGHDGAIFGSQTFGATTTAGRTVTVMANLYPGETDAQEADIRTALETALCTTVPTKPQP
ncbi:serine hydrolase domain-containing protein [Nocardia vulneris]|uniref:D-alanyl-D-alanine carboxypeptidase n=1 Tax=Nocardia vulneris TaxID=1141657 RepID=A0ABR4ZGK4_9NOCA|nr:serine hydrolase domain-containing protein [Nocardia vulneris]KIA64245.1 D-alanyl-D-alanine carboxypeptidase [Nocardia vulneris]